MSDYTLPDLWGVEHIRDGEYTGPGDNPPGYVGDWEEWPGVVDINGEFVCDTADIETARRIVHEHNTWPDLLAACKAAYDYLPDTPLGEMLAAAIAKAEATE